MGSFPSSLTTDAIKRMRLPRGPALPEVSTSAGLISDLHQHYSSHRFFPPLLHLLPPAATAEGVIWGSLLSPQWGLLKTLPKTFWHDKLSRLIVSLSLMAWQLITRLHNLPCPSLSFRIQPVLQRPLIWGETSLSRSYWAWPDRQGQEGRQEQTRNIHDYACNSVSKLKNKVSFHSTEQRFQHALQIHKNFEGEKLKNLKRFLG